MGVDQLGDCYEVGIVELVGKVVYGFGVCYWCLMLGGFFVRQYLELEWCDCVDDVEVGFGGREFGCECCIIGCLCFVLQGEDIIGCWFDQLQC